jgi:hypothetical protein
LSEELYISIIGEVFDGYTEFIYNNKPVYLKHFNIRDQRCIHKHYEKYKSIAISKGLETEDQLLKKIKSDGIWSDDDDLKIHSLDLEIKNLKQTQSQLFLPSQKELMGVDIANKISELLLLKSKKKEIIGKTAEDYAATRSNEEMLRYFLFEDEGFEKNLFNEEEFSEIEDYELTFLINKQNEIAERLSELNLQKSVLRPFFSMYMSSCENLNHFYGKPVIQLSIYQLKTAIFAKMFYNIFQYVEDIPDNIKDDPEKLLSYSDLQRNKGKKGQMIKDDSAASAVFGATSEDMKSISKNTNTVSLKDELDKNGGKLNMEQMMKLAGY